jgi:hypothetical protein
MRPRETGAKRSFAIATRLGLWVRFSDWSEEGQAVRPSRPSGERKTGPEVRDRRDHTKGGGCGPARMQPAGAPTCPGVARRANPEGAQRTRSTAPTRACSRRRRRPRPRGCGRMPADGGRARKRARGRPVPVWKRLERPVRTRGKRCSGSPWSKARACRPSHPP